MFFTKPTKKRIYLDHAAASPLHPEVKAAMLPFLENVYGNPSAIHLEGRAAKEAVEAARGKVANILGIKPAGITFTSGGTESNNLAMLGLIRKLHEQAGVAYLDMEIITTKIEHPSISEVLPVLQALGVGIRFVEVDDEGKITVPALEAVLSPKTVLLTFAYANSEVGVIQPVSRLARVVRRYERENKTKIFIHIDAAQAPLWLPCELERLDVDLMSLDVGKCRGPKGLGILATRNVSLLPILFGGGQEQGQRPGTENVASIVGAAMALQIAQATYLERAETVTLIRNEFIAILRQTIPQVLLNGPEGENRLANNINISLPNIDTEFAVVYLDTHGVAVSTKSACAGAGGGESTVVFEMSGDSKRAKSTLRLTLGEETTSKDLRYVLDILQKYQQKMLSLTK